VTDTPMAPPVGGGDVQAFRAILDRVAAVRPALKAVLEHATLVEVSPRRLSLWFESSGPGGDSFLATQAREENALALLGDAARAHFGADTEVRVDSGPRPPGATGATLAAIDAETRRVASDQARQAVEKHPLVAAAVRLFGAELREVRLPSLEE